MSVSPGGPDVLTYWLFFVALALVCYGLAKVVLQRLLDDGSRKSCSSLRA
ncbi:hypothetical protein [Haloprofundus halobius]|nr:hypothetical protein [Haloprofundus halobius]